MTTPVVSSSHMEEEYHLALSSSSSMEEEEMSLYDALVEKDYRSILKSYALLAQQLVLLYSMSMTAAAAAPRSSRTSYFFGGKFVCVCLLNSHSNMLNSYSLSLSLTHSHLFRGKTRQIFSSILFGGVVFPVVFLFVVVRRRRGVVVGRLLRRVNLIVGFGHVGLGQNLARFAR